MDILDHFAAAIGATGHAATRDGSWILVEPIGLKIEAEAVHRTDHDTDGRRTVVCSIEVRATHQRTFPQGINTCLAGFGEEEQKAFAYAADSWVSIVFWTIHEALLPTKAPDSGVECMDLLTRNEDTGEEFGWKFYVGPVGAAGDFFPDEGLDNLILAKRLLGSISAVALGKRVLWISAFIAKPNETEVFGDCWLNNEDWPDGLNDLYSFASEWKDVVTYTALKQFFILKPCELSEIKNYEKLKTSLPPMKKKNLFSRWLRKR